MLVMVVFVIVAMMKVMAAARGIGAGFGIERRLDIVHVSAEALDHLRNHVIGADTDAIAEQLDGEMTVAEVPRNAYQFSVVVGVDLQQGFGLGFHPDHSGFDRQPIPLAQSYGAWQVEQNVGPPLGPQRDAATMAAVEVD
jgi:hypothetical protein